VACARLEKTLPAFEPMSRTIAIAITKITKSIKEYSATFCPLSFEKAFLTATVTVSLCAVIDVGGNGLDV
jgi:hypothetical protein